MTLSETIELIEKEMEGGHWAASVHDCRPPHSRRDHPRKHSRVITLPEKFLTEQEALEAGVGAIASGWAGSTIVHRESATHSTLFELDRHRVTELVRALPAVLAAAREAEVLKRDRKREAQLATDMASDCLDEQKRREAAEARVATLERALQFVALWAWREDPPNANSKLTDAERLSVIKHHPTVKSFYETGARALLSKENADDRG